MKGRSQSWFRPVFITRRNIYERNKNICEDDGGFAVIIEDEKSLQEANAYVNLETDIYEYLEEINENYIGMLIQ